MTPVVTKFMVLVLIALINTGTKESPVYERDTLSYIGEVDLAGCMHESLTRANEWKQQEPNIVAIEPYCWDIEDPLDRYTKFLKKNPQYLPKHIPGKDEARL